MEAENILWENIGENNSSCSAEKSFFDTSRGKLENLSLSYTFSI